MPTTRLEARLADGIIREDVAFPSPSSAASVVIGLNANGRTEWVCDGGKDDGMPIGAYIPEGW